MCPFPWKFIKFNELYVGYIGFENFKKFFIYTSVQQNKFSRNMLVTVPIIIAYTSLY